MVDQIEDAAIDIIELIETGGSSPIEMGVTQLDEVRVLYHPEETEVDGDDHAPFSAWSIYAANEEYFFDDDLKLKAIKVHPSSTNIGVSGSAPTWTGQFELSVGGRDMTLAGMPAERIRLMRHALILLGAEKIGFAISGGEDRSVLIELSRKVWKSILKYEMTFTAIAVENEILTEVDYCLSSVWVLRAETCNG